MFMLYAACIIALCNISSLLCMNSTPFIVPYSYSMLNFRSLINPVPSQAPIELNALNEQRKQDQQESLCNSLVPTHRDYMHDLYKKVSLFLACKSPRYQDLIQCINACNDVKLEYSINEDHMGKFAFCRDTVNQKTSLFFYFLKNYNQKAATSGEILPTTWSPVAKRLNLVGSCKVIEVLIEDTNALLLNKIPHYHELVSFIHSNQKFDQLGNKGVSFDEDWKKKFVHDAFAMLCSPEPYSTLRTIIIMINGAKSKGLIQNEKDLGYYALNTYEPIFLENIKMKFSYNRYKGKIALLCSCIEQYNTACGDKVTPSVRLYHIYKTIEPLHINFPDTFDINLLNAEKIAFAEYAELLDAIGEIKKAYDDAVECCVKEQYPSSLAL